jgi:flagellar motor switch protein FliG
MSVATPVAGMSGTRKAAILCMALGTEAAARILQQLSPAEVERVSAEIATIPMVEPEVVSAVLADYQDAMRRAGQMADGGTRTAEALLEGALGPERARGAVARLASPPQPVGLARLARATPESLIGGLRGEHPQTLALVLAHIEPKLAAGVIEALPPSLGSEVLTRLATLERVTPEILAIVERVLGERVVVSLDADGRTAGGAGTAARLLTMMDGPASTALLEAVASRSGALADELRDLMFVFEDLQLLDDRAMQRLLREVASRELALALKAASDGLRAHVYRNMSERAVEALKEESELLGAVKVKDVQAAHAAILASARELQEAGEITIERAGADDVIV